MTSPATLRGVVIVEVGGAIALVHGFVTRRWSGMSPMVIATIFAFLYIGSITVALLFPRTVLL